MDSEDEEGNSYKQYEIYDGIVFLIELTPEIYTPLKELGYRSQLFEILSSINDLMSDLIITTPRTGIGIYMYNCETSSLMKSLKVGGMTRMFTLNDLNVPNMKLLSDVVQDAVSQINPLEKHIKYQAPTDPEQLKLILNKIMDELARKKQYNSKKLVWFTNNDKPFTKTSTKEFLWRIINDFDSFRYQFHPIFLDKFVDPEQIEKQPFNMKPFEDIFCNTNYLRSSPNSQSEYSKAIFKGLSKGSPQLRGTIIAAKIRLAILRFKEIKRILFSCNLFLGDGPSRGLACSVRGYLIYLKTKIEKFKHINTKGEYPKTVHLDTIMINEATGDEIKVEEGKELLEARRDKSNIRRGYELSGGKVIHFDSEQDHILRNYAFDHDPQAKQIIVPSDDEDGEDVLEEDQGGDDGTLPAPPTFSEPPYLKLLGFKGVDNFQSYYNSSPPLFVTADLNDNKSGSFTKSFTTFSSLYQSCRQLRKYGLVFGCLKRNSLPNLYALYPTKVEYSSRFSPEARDFPEGFLLVRIAWLDDIRLIPETYWQHAMDENQVKHGEGIQSNTQNTTVKEINLITPEIEELTGHWDELIRKNLISYYNPNDYPNPTLNYFYKIIKHNLLQMELSEEAKKLIKNDVMTNRVEQLRQTIMQNNFQVDTITRMNLIISGLAKMERARPVTNTTDSKRSKDTEEIDPKKIEQCWKDGTLDQFTLPQLKLFARRHQITMGAKKQDLISNMARFFENS